jgi:hypothetical protein
MKLMGGLSLRTPMRNLPSRCIRSWADSEATGTQAARVMFKINNERIGKNSFFMPDSFEFYSPFDKDSKDEAH